VDAAWYEAVGLAVVGFLLREAGVQLDLRRRRRGRLRTRATDQLV
jgi:hypothetical protein